MCIRDSLTGEYTRGLPGHEVAWRKVAQADANGATAPFGAPQKRDFMEGFRYRNDAQSTMKPDFFQGFPPAAVFERNLVWDTATVSYTHLLSIRHRFGRLLDSHHDGHSRRPDLPILAD